MRKEIKFRVFNLYRRVKSFMRTFNVYIYGLANEYPCSNTEFHSQHDLA